MLFVFSLSDVMQHNDDDGIQVLAEYLTEISRHNHRHHATRNCNYIFVVVYEFNKVKNENLNLPKVYHQEVFTRLSRASSTNTRSIKS